MVTIWFLKIWMSLPVFELYINEGNVLYFLFVCGSFCSALYLWIISLFSFVLIAIEYYMMWIYCNLFHLFHSWQALRQFLVIMNRAATLFWYMSFGEHTCAFLFGIYLWVESALVDAVKRFSRVVMLIHFLHSHFIIFPVCFYRIITLSTSFDLGVRNEISKVE